MALALRADPLVGALAPGGREARGLRAPPPPALILAHRPPRAAPRPAPARPRAAAGSDSLGLAKPANASYETSSKDGGSSPLSVVLIAIAVLAAISAAVVILRSRHKRQQGDALDPPPYAG